MSSVSRKKVLLIHHSDSLGGAGVSLLNTYKMLKDDYDVNVYLPHIKSQLAQFFKQQDVPIKAFGEKVGMISSYSGGPNEYSRTFLKNLLQINKTRKKLQQIIEHEKPDFVAVNSMTLTWAGKIIQKNNIKSLCFIRETYINSFGMKYICYCLDNYFDGIIFISDFDKKKFMSKAPYVEVIRNSIDIGDYSLNLSRKQSCDFLGINKESFNILFVGGTSELKGWSVIIKAFKELEGYNVNLIIAGSIDNNKAIANHKIKYIGEQKNMSIVYKASDVLVFPSTSPHQARPAFEAGMMKLPVIISDFEETHENIKNQVNGLTFKPGDHNDLAKKIFKLYADNDLRLKLGEENFHHTMRYHGFKNNKKKMLEFFAKI